MFAVTQSPVKRPGAFRGLNLAILWVLLVPGFTQGEEAADEVASGQAPRMILAANPFDQSLAERFPEQALILDGGEIPFTALQLRETTPRRQGAALIVAGAGESPAAGLAGSLRTHLPAGGWRTLAMALPAARVEPLPARVLPLSGQPASGEESIDDNGNGDGDRDAPQGAFRGLAIEVMTRDPLDQETLQEYQQLALARVAAGVQHLRQAGYENLVLIGLGAGADTVTRFVQKNPQQLPAGGIGLVWLYPHFQAPLDRELDAVFGREWDLPVLDLVDSHNHREAAAQRRAEATRGRFARYQQQTMPLQNLTGEGSQKRVAYRLRAWLKRHMLGREL